MIAEILIASLMCSEQPDRAELERAVLAAITDEIQHGIEATREQDVEAYMSRVPDDYYHIEEDGTRVDRQGLREMQTRAWSIIPRTNRLAIDVTRLELSCDGSSATVWTNQLWDRQMIGRDGTTEFNIVTTQSHRETWRETGDGWRNYAIDELGGTLSIDGVPQP